MLVSTFIWRQLLVAGLALLFGLVRQRRGKPIGFGTFIFVAVGSCSLAVIALRLSPTNPLPLLGAVVTGIGFLGAGALIRSGEKIGGFTSAATIWIMAVFGIAIGVGETEVGVVSYGAIWGVAMIDRFMELRSLGSHQRRLTLVADAEAFDRGALDAIVGRHELHDLVQALDSEAGTRTLVLAIKGTRKQTDALLGRLATLDGLRSYHLE